MPKHVVIIGGGIGGLAAAIRLAGRGHRVTLCEKNQNVGGKLNQWVAPHPHRPRGERPFCFDTGPSLLTLPLVFSELFAAVERDVRDYLPIRRLDPISRFVWADGQRFEMRADRDDLLAEVARFTGGSARGFARLLKDGRKIWDLAGDLFLSKSPEQALRGDGAFSPLNGLRMLTIPVRIGMFRKYARWVDRRVRNPRLREILYQYATYSGASPFKAPATLGVIPFVETFFGGWYIDGGMYQLATQLQRVACELGVDIQRGRAVEKVIVINSAAAGVRLGDGAQIAADAVVVNADVVYAYGQLVPPEHRPHYSDDTLRHIEPGGSGLVLLLGVEGTYPQLAHHTKFMPADYKSDLRAMFETRQVPDDPCIYVCAATRTDASQAPQGCENLFVLCSAPPLDGSIDWAEQGPRYRDQIVRTLETRFGLADLSRRIVVERRIDPTDLRRLYNANAGSIYGISSNSLKTAFLRPPNRDRKLPGLFFAGGATHPGGGLPLVALSGKIASELADEYLATLPGGAV